LGTDGSGAKNLIVKNGAIRHPDLSGVDISDDFNNIKNDNHLFMNGSEIFSFTSDSIPSLVAKTLEKNKIGLEGIDLFVLHQANKFILDHLRKKIKIPEDKFYIFLKNCGNTVSSTIPIALCEAKKENRLSGNILLCGFGVGYSWGSCIIRIN